MISIRLNDHLSEDVIELYCLGRLAPRLVWPVEEHFLLCDLCQRRIMFEEHLIEALRAAASEEHDASRSNGLVPCRRPSTSSKARHAP